MNIHMIDIENIPAIALQLKGKEIGYDVETTGLNVRTFKMVTIQFGTLENVYILDCRGYTIDMYDLWHHNLELLFCSISDVVGTNLAFDFIALYHHFGVKVKNMHDIMLQELVIYGEGWSSSLKAGLPVNLKGIGERYGMPVSKEETIWFVDLDQRPDDWVAPFPHDQIIYCVQDVLVPLKVNLLQTAKLETLELSKVAYLENTCIEPVSIMCYNGCLVDKEKWLALIDRKRIELISVREELQDILGHFAGIEEDTLKYLQELQNCVEWKSSLLQLEQYARDTCKKEGNKWKPYRLEIRQVYKEKYPQPPKPSKPPIKLNLNSHKQLLNALRRYGIPIDSTAEKVLKQHKHNFEILVTLMHYRKLEKFLTSFGEKFLDNIDIDGRIHPSYQQIGASTGRMSCSKPNWQQVPSKGYGDIPVRECIIASKGSKLLTADFSNIEMRILADMSKDANMLRIFEEGKDLHSSVARLMFNLDATDDELKGVDEKIVGDVVTEEIKPLEWFSDKTFRDVSKTIGFGLVYGMSAIGLARTLEVTTQIASSLMKQYFDTYPSISNWLGKTAKDALKNGYSTTIIGRKRFYDTSWLKAKKLSMTKYSLENMMSRQAKNAPIQGTSADITKHALILVHKSLPEGAKIVACVHDEIVVEAPEHLIEGASLALRTGMYEACRYHLRIVSIPSIENSKVTVADYWKK